MHACRSQSARRATRGWICARAVLPWRTAELRWGRCDWTQTCVCTDGLVMLFKSHCSVIMSCACHSKEIAVALRFACVSQIKMSYHYVLLVIFKGHLGISMVWLRHSMEIAVSFCFACDIQRTLIIMFLLVVFKILCGVLSVLHCRKIACEVMFLRRNSKSRRKALVGKIWTA